MGIHPRLPGLIADREPAGAPPSDLALDDGGSRRAFLAKVAVGGAALTLGSQLLPSTRLLPALGAQEGASLDGDETAVELLASVSLAAAAAYRVALAPGAPALPEPVAEVVTAYGRHHAQQATVLTNLLPEGHEVVANPTFAAEQAQAVEAAGSPEAVLAALRSLEETVTATQFSALARLGSQDDARAVATLAPIGAQHATVLGALAGSALTDLVLEAQGEDGAVTAQSHPVAPAAADGAGTDGQPADEDPTANEGGQGAGDGGTGQTGDGTDSSGGGATDDSTATTEG